MLDDLILMACDKVTHNGIITTWRQLSRFIVNINRAEKFEP